MHFIGIFFLNYCAMFQLFTIFVAYNGTYMLSNTIVEGSASMLADVENLEQEIFIFEDFSRIALPDKPVRLKIPILVLCTEGTCSVVLNLKRYELRKNSLLLMMPDRVLEGYHIGPGFKAKYISIARQAYPYIVPNQDTVLPIVVGFRENPLIELTPEQAADISQAHDYILDKMQRATGPYAKKLIATLLQAIIYEVLTIYHDARSRRMPERLSQRERLVSDFLNLANRECLTQRTVQYYADKLCISAKYLTESLKTLTGKTASEWIDSFVLMSAKVMLRSSSATIKEIALELGFRDQSLFGKYFKNKVGQSPQRYRKG